MNKVLFTFRTLSFSVIQTGPTGRPNQLTFEMIFSKGITQRIAEFNALTRKTNQSFF